MSKNPYEILGVSTTATQDEIKNAYRGLAKKLHPDLNPGNKSAESRIKEINSAYELIGTAEGRAKFDRGEYEQEPLRSDQGRGGPYYRETQSGGGRYSQVFGEMDDDLLHSIFGRMGRGGAFESSGDRPGQDALYRMEVSFRDAVLGAEREITLPSGKRLRVKIPGGVDSGAKLRFSGLGEPGSGKGPPGDAYVELDIKPSPLFKRNGAHLEIELPVSISEALLGAEVKVPTVDGSVLLKIPPGVSSGNRLRVSGKGVVNSNTGNRGDQYVTLKLVSPASVDDDMKQAIESWSKRQPFDPRTGWIGAQGASS